MRTGEEKEERQIANCKREKGLGLEAAKWGSCLCKWGSQVKDWKKNSFSLVGHKVKWGSSTPLGESVSATGCKIDAVKGENNGTTNEIRRRQVM